MTVIFLIMFIVNIFHILQTNINFHNNNVKIQYANKMHALIATGTQWLWENHSDYDFDILI